MLLHPNQFSITNPASPGGAQSNRRTRNAKHKIGEADDITGAENKRKRKLFEEIDESPGPSGRNLELGVGSPFREAKAKTIHTQFEAPAYSIDRLFTEKELTMAMNNATIAAAHFFTKMKNGDSTNQDTATNGTNGVNHDHNSDNEAGGPSNDLDHDSDSPPAMALEMTRQVSSNPHATRGATRSALGDLAALATARTLPFASAVPFILPANIGSKPNAPAPPPAPLSSSDADQDLLLMMRDAPPDDPLNDRLLQEAVAPRRTREFQYQPPGMPAPVPEMTSHVRALAPHLDVASMMGGIPMSAQSSMGGYSEHGGNTPLGRFGETANALGGVGMRREASGSGRRGGRRAL